MPHVPGLSDLEHPFTMQEAKGEHEIIVQQKMDFLTL
jgi:hypothetical protein